MSTHLPRPRRLSREGLLLIKSFEGFRPQAVRRRDGQLVIGYGHTRSARPGVVITESEAELLLLYDLLPITEAIEAHVPHPLNQHQFDALASFILSIGIERFTQSDVLSHLANAKPAEAAQSLLAYPDRVPPPMDTPYRRRAAERALFETPEDQTTDLAALLTAPITPVTADATRPRTFEAATIPVLRHETKMAHRPDATDLGALAFVGSIAALTVAAGSLTLKQRLPMGEMGDGSLWLGAGLMLAGIAFLGLAAWQLVSKRNNKRII